jgi:hypothetical protein
LIAYLTPTRLDNWLSLKRHKADEMFNANIKKIASSTFVLTDTYHACINAMRVGVPVFAIGRKSNGQEGTLGDFKKQKLFEMFNASQFYFTIEENEDENIFYERVIDKIHNFINSDTNDYEGIKRNLMGQQESFTKTLTDFFNN